MHLLRALHRGADRARAGRVCICDPAAAARAHAAGAGTRPSTSSSARARASPATRRCAPTIEVEALGDGRFTGTGPFYRGSRFELGPMALLRAGDVRIAVASRKQQAADQAMFRHLGVEPADHACWLLKSSVHFRADFGAMASRIMVVEGPGPERRRPRATAVPKAAPGRGCGRCRGAAPDRGGSHQLGGNWAEKRQSCSAGNSRLSKAAQRAYTRRSPISPAPNNSNRRGSPMTDKKTVGSVTYTRTDKEYFEKRGLRRYARVWSLWALGVGAVISGHFSGWNFGLGVRLRRHAHRRCSSSQHVLGPDLQHRRDVARAAAHRRARIRSRAARWDRGAA